MKQCLQAMLHTVPVIWIHSVSRPVKTSSGPTPVAFPAGRGGVNEARSESKVFISTRRGR